VIRLTAQLATASLQPPSQMLRAVITVKSSGARSDFRSADPSRPGKLRRAAILTGQMLSCVFSAIWRWRASAAQDLHGGAEVPPTGSVGSRTR
jgi:hypothetical protein